LRVCVCLVVSLKKKGYSGEIHKVFIFRVVYGFKRKGLDIVKKGVLGEKGDM